jgi:hypothetical protein
MYWLFKLYGREKNFAKAREIYQMGLKVNSEEKKFVVERLESLKKNSVTIKM